MNQDIIDALQQIADTNQRFYTLMTSELAGLKALTAALSDSHKAFIASELKIDPLQLEKDFQERLTLYQSNFLSASRDFLAQSVNKKTETENS